MQKLIHKIKNITINEEDKKVIVFVAILVSIFLIIFITVLLISYHDILYI